MSEKLNLFCKNCEVSWDDIEIKKCPNCSKKDITVVQTIDNNNKSKIYLILPLLIFVVSALFISNDYFDLIKTNLIDFVFQKDDVLIEDNEGPRDQWLPNYYDNGQVKQEGGSWKGMKDGLWTSYYMNGEVETLGFWKEDEKNGSWKYFHKNGLLKHEEQWKNGNLISLSGREVKVDNNIEVNDEDDEVFKEEESITDIPNQGKLKKHYHENGKLKAKGYLKNGKKNGLWTYYDIQGRLETEGVWRKNKQDGIWKYYDDNGNIIKEGVWRNDKKDGLWREIDVKGEIYKEENWEDGKYVGHNDLNGKTYTSGNTSAKEQTSKTTIRIKSLPYLPSHAIVSPDGKYLYFNVGVNPFKGYIFDLKKKELVGVFQDKGYGLLTGKAFYEKEDNALYFVCVRNIGTVKYKVFLETATGINLGRGNFNNFHYKSKGYQEVASQELGKVILNGSTFNNAVRLDNKSVVQIKLDRVVIIQ